MQPQERTRDQGPLRRASGWLIAIVVWTIVVIRLVDPESFPSPGPCAPAVIASGAILALEIAASVAGRGRSLPALWLVPLARLLLIGAIVLALAPYNSWSYRVFVAAFALVCEVSSRLGGPSLLLPIALYFSVVAAATGPISGGGIVIRRTLGVTLAEIAAMVLVLSVLRWRRFDRERLRAVGITPWAPADLAAVPLLAQFLYRVDAVQGAMSIETLYTVAWPLGAVAISIALVYLERRLRAAEAHAG